ncbi:MAG: Ig-like domain-containing protein [Paludibacteraceae bacterium]|nr:Ig-like domain-containing protein [Paludibacteraceae bacterium]
MRKTFLFIFALCAASVAWGTTVTKTITELKTTYSWTSGSNYPTFDLDEVISVDATDGTYNNGRYYENADRWRLFTNTDFRPFVISAKEGYVITSVTFTFSGNAGGMLFDATKKNQLTSGTAFVCTTPSVTFYSGYTGTGTESNIRTDITQFSVTYEKGIVETFERNTGGASTADRAGAYYTWTITTGVRTKTTDILFNKTPSIWLSGNGDASMETKTTIEGGVKYVSFLWNKFNKTASPVKVSVTAGDITRELEKTVQTGDDYNQNHPDLVFGDNFGVKSNAKLKIANPQTTTALQIGPITIVPYLRYTYTETQEVKIGAGTFDCSLQIDNTDGEGSIAYSSSNTDVVSFANAANPEATLVGGGEATITATWGEGASTSFKLKVIAKSTPEISFAQSAITITDLYTTDPVANELTVTEGAGEVTYKTSNPLVAKIVENQVMVVGAGTATITATAAENEDYLSASATYALTVNEPTGETAVSENFKGNLAKQDSYTNTEASFTDQLGLYSWKANGYRYNEVWVRLKNTETPYLKFDGNQEGGIKRLVFNWFRAGGTPTPAINTKITIVDGETQLAERSIVFDANDAHGSLQPYNVKMEVKQNAQLIINNFGSPAVMHFQDISIVPYVLYTEKAQTANAADETYDATTGLINNAPAGEVTYSIITEGAQATIDEATGEVEMSNVTTSEDIVIKASYGDAYTTMNLHVNALPIPVVTFPNLTDNKKTVDMNQAPFTESISVKVDDEEVSEPTITYESSDETVAKVNTEGVITIIGEGVTTITAMIDACQTYAAAEASYELTITDPKEDAVMEKFTAYTGDEWTWSSAGTDYTLNGDLATWNTHYARRQEKDKLTSGDNATWMSVIEGIGGSLKTTNLEGGVKRIAFAWNQQSDNNGTSVGVDIYVGDTKVAGASHDKVATIGADYQFNQNIFSKSSNLTIKNASVGGNGRILVGDMTITPYLLYTIKAQTHDLAEGNELSVVVPQIDNRDNENAISYSYNNIEGEEADVVSISGTTITALKAGKTEIVATWDGVSTSYILTIKEATPVFSFDPAEQTLQLGDMTGTALKPTITEGLTYSYDATSGDKEVATVDAEGNLTIHGIGETTIKAVLPAQGSYAAAEAQYTLTVEKGDLSDETVDEKFSKYNTEGWTTNESNDVIKKGDVYDWHVKLTRHKGDDKLVGGQQAIWFNTNGYVATADAEDNNKIGPAEGGIKRIAFDWNQNGDNQTGDDLYISISVDNEEVSAIRRDGGAQPEQPWQYIHNLNVKKNATLKIENKSTTSEKEGGRVKIGTIVITPYLLYTNKEVSKMFNEGSYINTGLTNNIKVSDGGTLTFTSSNEAVATIDTNDETHKDKVVFHKAGDVTISANWTPDGEEEPAITTSYLLHITEKADRGLYFQEAVKETAVGGSAVTNTLNGTLDATEQTWSTASEGAITSVDNNGLVSPVAIGTDTVTVVVAASDTYQEGTASYQVIVRSGVADGNKLVEGFSNITTTSTTAAKWEGDLKDYFSWNVVNARRSEDKIAGEVGVWMSAKGSIATDDVIEGGIKYFTFNWMQPSVEKGATLRLNLAAGEKNYHQDYVVTTDNGGSTNEIFYFAGNMQVKKNVQLTLTNESFTTESGDPLTSNGRITFDAFEIVPYLFYKTKYHKMDVANGDPETWTNTDLINNTEGDGTIVYSVPEGNGVATIDPESGEVTAEGNGITTVTATWTPADAEDGEVVTTTYEVEVFYSKLDAELAFDPEEITVGVDAITFSAPTLSNPHGLTVTYSSDNEDIATVDENSGEVTLQGVAGDVTISATSEETDTYQEGNASYTIHVLLLTSEVTFPNLTDNEKTVNIDADPFTENISVKVNDEEVSEPTITYESSNENAARVNETTGEVTIIGVGETTITAKVAAGTTYPASEASYTLTVEAPLITEDNSWTETFSQIDEHTSWQKSSSVTDQKGDGGVFTWQFLNYRTYTSGDYIIGLRSGWAKPSKKNDYVAQQTVSEGGIKYISMIWVPNSNDATNPNPVYFTMGDMTSGSILRTYQAEANTLSTSEPITTTMRYDVKKNAQLRVQIKNSETEAEQYNSIKIKSITVVPYLLYTKKEVSVTYELDGTNEVDVTENLINNLEEDEKDDVIYSLSDGVEATIDGSTITLANATENVVVTAKWTEGDNTITTTFTLKVTKTEEPVVVPDYVLEGKTAGAYATICLPNKIDHVENATLYSISHGNTSAIEFVEANYTTDEAGMPYLVQVENDGNVNFFYTEDEPVAAPVSAEEAKGFVGKLAEDNPFEPTYVPSNGTAILVSGGQLHIAGEWCVLTQNHAYITTTYLPETATPSSAPRKTIRLYNPEAQAPTGNPSLHHSINSSFKIIKEGHLYIIRDTKMYNAQGILVE